MKLLGTQPLPSVNPCGLPLDSATRRRILQPMPRPPACSILVQIWEIVVRVAGTVFSAGGEALASNRTRIGHVVPV